MRSHVITSYRLRCARFFSQSSSRAREALPSTAPKPHIDTRHIRQSPELWSRNCIARSHTKQQDHPFKIVRLFDERRQHQVGGRSSREGSNKIQTQLSQGQTQPGLIEEARRLKKEVSKLDAKEAALTAEIHTLAAELPNLTSPETPRGEPKVVGYINQDLESPLDSGEVDPELSADHAHIGTALNLIDLTSAAKTSGWGWYFLKDEVADLEDALIQYALSVARKHGFRRVTPPSIVHDYIGTACGFRPRDQNDEQQIYNIQPKERNKKKAVSSLSLAGTAEIPFAGMMANEVLDNAELPIMVVGNSRCYRAEAGARGAATKGLYRVHEFTKVEMFAWTALGKEKEVFNTMLQIQTEILTNLGLKCRILEMPASDLGASAFRKRDIEAYFPSRKKLNEGWGEVTSTSICTDYQTRRLNTRVKNVSAGETNMEYPSTVNGTALAVPRILAALLENRIVEEEGRTLFRVPEVLRHWMQGREVIEWKASPKK